MSEQSMLGRVTPDSKTDGEEVLMGGKKSTTIDVKLSDNTTDNTDIE
jgi:hypothetical protein